MILPVTTSPDTDDSDIFSQRQLTLTFTYDYYPFIYDSELYLEYRSYERSAFLIYQCFPVAFLYIIGILVRQLRLNALVVEMDSVLSMVLTGPYSIVSLALIIMFGILLLFFLLLKIPQLLSKLCNSCSLRARRIQSSWIGRKIENSLSVLLTLIFACILFYCACDNPSSAENEIILLCISPIICAICSRGVSIKAICICYSIEVAFILMIIIQHTPKGVTDFGKVKNYC
jgi:hypothetical protein